MNSGDSAPPGQRPPEGGLTDQQVEIWISVILRSGVLIAAALGVCGMVYTIAVMGSQEVHDQVFRGEPADLRSVQGILMDAAALRPRGVVQLALLLLLMTPLARVAFSIGAFAAQRDWMYVFVTCIVLSTLLLGILGGL